MIPLYTMHHDIMTPWLYVPWHHGTITLCTMKSWHHESMHHDIMTPLHYSPWHHDTTTLSTMTSWHHYTLQHDIMTPRLYSPWHSEAVPFYLVFHQGVNVKQVLPANSSALLEIKRLTKGSHPKKKLPTFGHFPCWGSFLGASFWKFSEKCGGGVEPIPKVLG